MLHSLTDSHSGERESEVCLGTGSSLRFFLNACVEICVSESAVTGPVVLSGQWCLFYAVIKPYWDDDLYWDMIYSISGITGPESSGRAEEHPAHTANIPLMPPLPWWSRSKAQSCTSEKQLPLLLPVLWVREQISAISTLSKHHTSACCIFTT